MESQVFSYVINRINVIFKNWHLMVAIIEGSEKWSNEGVAVKYWI